VGRSTESESKRIPHDSHSQNSVKARPNKTIAEINPSKIQGYYLLNAPIK
jgi:hypothetical protein